MKEFILQWLLTILVAALLLIWAASYLNAAPKKKPAKRAEAVSSILAGGVGR